jgi:hypothetical protein
MRSTQGNPVNTCDFIKVCGFCCGWPLSLLAQVVVKKRDQATDLD